MKNYFILGITGEGYLHDILYTPRGVFAIISVKSPNKNDDIWFEVKLEDRLLELLLSFAAQLEHKSVLLKFTAQYSQFGSHHVDYDREAGKETNILIFRVNQFEIHDCLVNGIRDRSLINSLLAKAA